MENQEIREMENARVIYFARMIDEETVKVCGTVQFDNMSMIAFKRAVIVPAPINSRTINVAIKDELRNCIERNLFKAKSIEFTGHIEGMPND